MKAIIIGAGRGERLMPTTESSPKCFAEVRGRRGSGRNQRRRMAADIPIDEACRKLRNLVLAGEMLRKRYGWKTGLARSRQT